MTEATTRPAEEERSRVAAAVYGTILVIAMLSYLSEDEDLGRGEVATALVGTGLAYYAAHVYVDYLAARMTGVREPTLALSRRLLGDELPLLQAMVTPGVPLILGGIGLWSRDTGVEIALVVAFAGLVGWGYRAGRRSFGSMPGAFGSALVAVALGLIVVGLKNLLH